MIRRLLAWLRQNAWDFAPSIHAPSCDLLPRKGDLCAVDGEGDTVFVVREVGKHMVYLVRVDGRDGAIGLGRDSLHKLSRLTLTLADLEFATTARRRRKT